MEVKEQLSNRFKELYPDKRLLAVRLDGFSHSVWYDDGTNNAEPDQDWYSACAPEIQAEHQNNDTVKKLFKGIAHWSYQNNPLGIVYVNPKER